MARTKKTAQAPETTPEAAAQETNVENRPIQKAPEAAPATTPEPETANKPEAMPQDQTPEQSKEPETPDQQPEEPEALESMPAGEAPLPYTAAVSVAIAMVRKTVGPGTADMLKAVGTLKQGTQVTVINRHDGFAQLANGLWINEAFLTLCHPV